MKQKLRIKVRHSTPQTKTFHNYRWEDLTPTHTLNSGIMVYDNTSFPNIHDIELVGTPYEPKLVNVDNFWVEKGVGLRWYELGPSYVLVMHGVSTSNHWRQKASPNVDIEKLIKSIEDEGIQIDVLAVCNPARYRLPKRNGQISYTYPLQKSKSKGFVLENGQLTSQFTAEKVLFKGN